MLAGSDLAWNWTDMTCTHTTKMFPQWGRPPLSKKSFPVGQVGKKTASREVGIFYVFLISFFF